MWRIRLKILFFINEYYIKKANYHGIRCNRYTRKVTYWKKILDKFLES